MKPFIVYPKKSRILLLGLGSLIFVAIGAGFLYIASTEEENKMMLWIIGSLSIIFFGFAMLYYLYILFNRKPALIIDEQGIHDNSSYIGAGLVKWEEIEDIQWVKLQRQLYLGLYTYDRALITNRTSGLKKALNKMNKGLIDSQVNITMQILDCTPEQLIEEIHVRRPQVDNSSFGLG